MKRMSKFNWVSIVLGVIFLYLPIVVLIVYSFNHSKLVTVWGGWSLKWYKELFQDEQILSALWYSLLIGFISATIATVLGTMTAFALTRLGAFRGRRLLGILAIIPLVLPEVMIGLSLTTVFTSLSISRGLITIIIAHITLSMCYVVITVRARLYDHGVLLEEAASDLGCPPIKVFWNVTLPLIAPSIIAGWFLAFAISFDDYVVAYFTTGGGVNTLPMKIYSSIRLGLNPTVNALTTILLGIIIVCMVMMHLVGRLKAKRASFK